MNLSFFSRSKLLVLLLLAAVLIACGSDGNENSASTNGVVDGATSATNADAETTDSPPAAASDSEPEETTFTTVTDADEGEDLPPTPNAAELAATQAVLLPLQEPIDACELLSEEEAAVFLGAEITSVENETGDHTGTCNYIAQTTIDRLHLKISWTPNFGAGDYELVRSMVQNPREEGTDIGDDYYIRDELSGVQLRLVRGEQYLVLEAYGVSEPDGPLKELAQRLLAQIPPGG